MSPSEKQTTALSLPSGVPMIEETLTRSKKNDAAISSQFPPNGKLYVLKGNSWQQQQQQHHHKTKQTSHNDDPSDIVTSCTLDIPLKIEIASDEEFDTSSTANAAQNSTSDAFQEAFSPSLDQQFVQEIPSGELSALDSNWAQNFSVPWERMPPELMRSLELSERPHPSLRRMMIRIISDEIRRITFTPGRKALSVITKKIVDEYPASFADSLCGEIVGSGNESLLKQLVNRLENLNRQPTYEKKRMFHCKRPEDREKETHEQRMRKKSFCRNYGCINWQPPLPINETEHSLIVKQEEMKKMCSPSHKKFDREWALKLLHDTFYLQRKSINSQLDIRQLLCDWPLLFWKEGILSHFHQLVGIDLESKFLTSLVSKGPGIISFLKNVPVHSNALLKVVLAEIENSKCETDCSQGKFSHFTRKRARHKMTTSDLVMLIMGYFGEDTKVLFRRADSAADVEKMDIPTTPCVIYCGSKLNSSTSFMLSIRGHVVNDEIQSFSDAFLLMFASFYCFDIEYPTAASATLEFVQRCLFNINPDRGTKVQKTGKRHAINPKVLTLLNAIIDHEWLLK